MVFWRYDVEKIRTRENLPDLSERSEVTNRNPAQAGLPPPQNNNRLWK
jgi:hypothetical protein